MGLHGGADGRLFCNAKNISMSWRHHVSPDRTFMQRLGLHSVGRTSQSMAASLRLWTGSLRRQSIISFVFSVGQLKRPATWKIKLTIHLLKLLEKRVKIRLTLCVLNFIVSCENIVVKSYHQTSHLQFTLYMFRTLRPEQNDHISAYMFKCIFFNENWNISISTSLEIFVTRVQLTIG